MEHSQTLSTHEQAFDWITAIQIAAPSIAIITVVLGAFLAWQIRKWEKNQEAKSLAASIRGELLNIIDLTKRRDYEKIAERLLNTLKSGQDVNMPRWVDPRLTSRELAEYNYTVYMANISHIGMLGPQCAERISCVYGKWKAIQTDLANFAQGDWDGKPIEAKFHVIDEDLKIWREAVKIAEPLIEELGDKDFKAH